MSAGEADRLAALRRYRILDTEPEQRFDDLVLLASHVCGAPMAAITLIDSDRQWFKARLGVSVSQTSRDVAFCAHAIQQRELFVVPDALRDARFRDNPLVRAEPNIRFYAGAPLVTPEGHALGTICVLDREPRVLTDAQKAALEALKRQVIALLELRVSLDELAGALAARDQAEQDQDRLIAELREALDSVERLSSIMPVLLDVRDQHGRAGRPGRDRRRDRRGDAVAAQQGLAGREGHGSGTGAAGGPGQRGAPRLRRRSVETRPVLRDPRRRGRSGHRHPRPRRRIRRRGPCPIRWRARTCSSRAGAASTSSTA